MKCKENLKKKGNGDSVAAYKPQAWDYCRNCWQPMHWNHVCITGSTQLHYHNGLSPVTQIMPRLMVSESHARSPYPAEPGWTLWLRPTDTKWQRCMLLKKNSLDLEITVMSSLFIPLTLWFFKGRVDDGDLLWMGSDSLVFCLSHLAKGRFLFSRIGLCICNWTFSGRGWCRSGREHLSHNLTIVRGCWPPGLRFCTLSE